MVASAPVDDSTPVPEPIEPHPFEALWDWLIAEELPPPPRLSAEEAAQVVEMVPRVLAHYTKHRPDPASFPALAVQIVEMTRDPNLEVRELLRLISLDPAISMQVLRVANSAYYSRGYEIQDLRRAVMHLGLREVGDLASGVASRSLFDPHLKAEFQAFAPRWNQMFLDTMTVAFSLSTFAFEQHQGRADYAFLSGMFHDIGKSIALRSMASLIHEGQMEAPLSEAVVDEVLERVHVEVGADLHIVWNLPDYLSQICLRHHDFELPEGFEFLDIHALRAVEGIYGLLQDPSDSRHLHETRQSLSALALPYLGALRVYSDLKVQRERVQMLFSA